LCAALFPGKVKNGFAHPTREMIMRYPFWEEIEQFTRILEAEAAGHPVDADHAASLARTLAHHYPAIARSMHLAIERLERNLGEATAAPA